MRTRMYGGVRGRKTKVGGKPTFVFLLLDYMPENQHFNLKCSIGEFIRKNQKWLVNLLVNRSECGFTNIF